MLLCEGTEKAISKAWLAPTNSESRRKLDQLFCRSAQSLVSYKTLASPLYSRAPCPQAPIDTNQWSRVARDTRPLTQECARRALRAPRRALKEIEINSNCRGSALDVTPKIGKQGERKTPAKPASSSPPAAEQPRDLRGPPRDRRRLPCHRLRSDLARQAVRALDAGAAAPAPRPRLEDWRRFGPALLPPRVGPWVGGVEVDVRAAEVAVRAVAAAARPSRLKIQAFPSPPLAPL